MGLASPAPCDVVLASFGAPRTLDDIEPYLVRLFSDRRILPIPLRGFVARRIARRRAPKVRPKYERIGGGSPLAATTEEQARLLQAELARRGAPHAVRPGFLYIDPTVSAALDAVPAGGPPPLVLPLFPQRSFAGAGSVEDQVGRRAATIVGDFHDHPGFLAWHATRVREALAGEGERSDDSGEGPAAVLFAAHSIPQRFVAKGDRYVQQIEASARGVMAALGDDVPPHHIGYHSRIGPVEWVGPTLAQVLERLPAVLRRLVVVPLSFVGEHLETRFDLDLEFRELVRQQRPDVVVHRTPSPTTEPDWIALLGDLVEEHT